MHFTGYFKNRTFVDRERNYFEFVFRHAFKSLLVRKKLYKELMNLEQGNGLSFDFYKTVYMKIYKVPTIKFPKTVIIGEVFSLEKDIRYLFKLVKHAPNKFYLEVKLVSHVYKVYKDKYCYTGNSTENIYFIFENDGLTWS